MSNLEPIDLFDGPTDTGYTVRFILESGVGWLGAWDRAAFDAYRNAIIEECAKECEAQTANADPRLGYVQSYNTAISHLAEAIRALKGKV